MECGKAVLRQLSGVSYVGAWEGSITRELMPRARVLRLPWLTGARPGPSGPKPGPVYSPSLVLCGPTTYLPSAVCCTSRCSLGNCFQWADGTSYETCGPRRSKWEEKRLLLQQQAEAASDGDGGECELVFQDTAVHGVSVERDEDGHVRVHGGRVAQVSV